MSSKSANDILRELEEDTSSSSSDDTDKDAKEEEEFNEPCPAIDMVTLISCDGFHIHLPRKIACMSPLLKCAFKSGAKFSEAIKSEFQFSDIRGVVLEKIVDYLQHSFMYSDDIKSAPKFDVKDDILLETLVAADYLMI